MDLKKGNKIEVIWIDAHQEVGWLDEKDAEVFPLAECRSMGYFINDTGKAFRIADSLSIDKTCTVLAIPKGCIEKISLLEVENGG